MRLNKKDRLELQKSSNLPDWVPLFNFACMAAFVILIIVLIVIIRNYGVNNQKMKEVNLYIREISEEFFEEWDKKYSQGYKIIIFADGKVRRTRVDSLNKQLKINWQKVKIEKIEANQFKGTDEKIKVEIPQIYFEPYSIEDLMLRGTFIRRKGAKIVLISDKIFKVEIILIEDWGEELVFLFGFN